MEQHTPIRGRFAPTPSGKMHIGNALTALLGWLQIRSMNGQYILRIEDIDTQRSRQELTVEILRDLEWLGLDWDEGPGRDGDYGPYHQAARQALYEREITKLQHNHLLYPCYCSRADITAASRAPHGIASEGLRYPGTCRYLSEEEATIRKLRKKPSLRMKVPQQRVSFIDGIAGAQSHLLSDGGDFVVRRADDMISYQLAVVVDDALMDITHVLRGADLLDSTPRQLLLYQALGYEPPQFAHTPLMVDAEGRRLAKRTRGLSLSFLRGQGVKPERVIGWLAWTAGLLEKPEPVTPADLISLFDLSKIPSSPIKISDETRQQLFET
ncbi:MULTISPECIES: tRNA glutamyl-Q(34) synthetase GluQRS [Paenibacillus]|uniref:tRNA glutamyl-Q(34) synthetase GluQRS n=1 Tax=Paenibacillus TaxID=44249 RepID=UPI0011647140|nr:MULTISPECIES: tRNA glutamyl-Q(34) synthetase GluQRS [Paenibacillus]AWP27022.1 tRNA glutamyl-Q(34) synthetase GluQRS [Paenibacillus sp. Cedars]MPY18213.1 tRNA glutamyl-Q(34) synthetase GluQRS [Paenibacillus glucanolyticus]